MSAPHLELFTGGNVDRETFARICFKRPHRCSNSMQLMKFDIFSLRMLVLLILLASTSSLQAQSGIAMRFDVGTYCCGCTSNQQNFCDAHFNGLNYTTQRHYLAMGFDTQRSEILANNNALAVYHNDLNSSYTFKTPAQKANEVNQYALTRFATNGPRPDWLVMNEISAGLWPNTPTYRTWLIDLMTSLTQTYNYKVILASPFANPGANNASWQALSNLGVYIGVENYLSGEEVRDNGYSVAWCQAQYQSSKNSYIARGVAPGQIFLFEHFGNNVAGTGWGRSGVSVAEWDQAILVRGQAIQNVAFAGFCSYAWSSNSLGASAAEQVHFEDTYASQLLPTATSAVSHWDKFN